MEINSNKIKDFLSYMESNEVAMESGFKLVVDKKLILDFYQSFKEREFLKPVPQYKQQLIDNQINAPFWPPLIYLEALVKSAPASFHDWEGVHDLLKDALESEHVNYRTGYKLVEICSELPVGLISNQLLKAISNNLISDVDNSLALSVFVNKFCPKIIDCRRLNEGFFECVKKIYSPVPDSLIGEYWEGRQFFKADAYWLKLFAESYSFKIGSILGEQYLEYMRPFLESIFPSNPAGYPTWLIRPAIEDHDQNKDWYSSENIVIISTRNALIGLCRSSAEQGWRTVSRLYKGSPIERRLAIHALSNVYSCDESRLQSILDKNMFDDDLIHETYHFLNLYFGSFSTDFQNLILEIFVSRFNLVTKDDQVLRKVLRWLSAMEFSGNQRVIDMISDIRKNKTIGLPEHPDFFAYMESGFGPGPTPFSESEILYFLDQGEISKKLNGFKGSNDIFSENREALCNELEGAVKSEPIKFLQKLDQLTGLEVQYKYAIANAFANIYSRGEFSSSLRLLSSIRPLINWLVSISEEMSGDECLELPSTDFPNDISLFMAVSDLIKSISRIDENHFELEDQIKSLDLLKTILDMSGESNYTEKTDPMHYSINSPRGMALEAAIILALRVCRQLKNSGKSVSDGWKYFEPFFNQELVKLEASKNIEFCSLASRYILQFNFMSDKWTLSNYENFFNPQDKLLFYSAMDGVAYAPSSSFIYKLLKKSGSLDRGMKALPETTTARKKLLERIILAYSWGRKSFLML